MLALERQCTHECRGRVNGDQHTCDYKRNQNRRVSVKALRRNRNLNEAAADTSFSLAHQYWLPISSCNVSTFIMLKFIEDLDLDGTDHRVQ